MIETFGFGFPLILIMVGVLVIGFMIDTIVRVHDWLERRRWVFGRRKGGS